MIPTTPLGAAIRTTAPTLLRGTAVGLLGILGGATLTAAHQIVYEEGRDFIRRTMSAISRRRRRNEVLQINIVGSCLPLQHQETIRNARDSYRAAIGVLADPNLPEAVREKLRAALLAVTNL